MTSLTLATANAIIEGAFARGAELGLKPLGVSVLDAGGHLVAFQRQDGASFLRPQMSAGKAYGALSIGAGSRRLEAFAKERPHLMAGVSDVSGGRIVAVAGGVLILNRDGRRLSRRPQLKLTSRPAERIETEKPATRSTRAMTSRMKKTECAAPRTRRNSTR